MSLESAERKGDDYDELVNTALRKAGSKKALLPSRSKNQFKEVDLRDLTLSKRKFVVEEALESEDADASKFFGKLKSRFQRAHVSLASVEVRFKDLSVSTEVAVGARGEPTVLNAFRNKFEVTGDIMYNGKGFDEFRAVHTSSYVDQNDLHQPLLTVKETMDFAARVQGIGHKAEELRELHNNEKAEDIEPDWEVDTLLKAAAREGKRESIITDLIIKLLGLDVCADTLIGSDQVRGVSGGQRKRVTTGELLVGPKKVLFLDEISTGLDSSTTFQISRTLRDFCHLRDATMLVALLQPTPETYNLFDDILLMSEGKMVYHGCREGILPFFASIGMDCPARKADSDFLQEVTSLKDQQQYWNTSKGSYKYIPVAAFAQAFQQTETARENNQAVDKPYVAPNPKCDEALFTHKYALPLTQRMLALGRRELTLMKRNFVVYKAKTIQVAVMGLVTATLFLRTHIHPISPNDGQEIAGFLYFATLIMLFNGIAELTMTVNNLPVFWKQQRLLFFDAFSYSLPAFLLRIPFSAAASLVWTVLTYFPVGLAGEPSRIYWMNPLAYIQRAILVNEFTAPYGSGATQMVTEEALAERKAALEGDPGADNAVTVNMPQDEPMHSAQRLSAAQQPEHAMESRAQPSPAQQGTATGKVDAAEELAANHASQKGTGRLSSAKGATADESSGMVLPFDPMTMTFKDLHYSVPIPKEAAEGKEHVHNEGNQPMLELLLGISGAFRPGVLTCLMGVSGAGKTTLMDVLAGRKTSGKIEGEIRINGHTKEQETFARVSGYVEQFDTHTAASTVYESLLFSGTLRNGTEVDAATTQKFVDQVLGLVELQTMKNAVVGRSGESGLSVEQRKRLTIAVELVANPSIVFMDEPTSGLDARAAAIVMRTVRSIVNTGRTIVCTIHQPSIDIFESFDELLLLKRGGETIFNGQLGQLSNHLIDYFQSVEGVPAIEEGMNPATWMLKITTPGMESKLGVSFAEYYASSDLAKHYARLLEDYSSPVEGSKQLKFDTQYPKPLMTQFWAIFAKYTAAYWRMPEYNGIRFLLAVGVGFTFGAMFWRLGDKGGLTNVLGALYATTLFFSIINATVIQPVVFAERAVSYRERAAGTYSVLPWVMALGCVEIIYILIQGTIYCAIVYWMCWFQRDAGKFFWFMLFNLLTLTYFTFFGMLCVALAPTLQLAAVCSAYVYSIFNLFAGFAITQPNMPGWW
ncbi:hypothetical protein ABBQ38_006651 [Trebouxia sp. C0009 RCD-2024]